MPRLTQHDLASIGVARSTFGATVSITTPNTSTTIWNLTSGRTANITKIIIANRTASAIQVAIGQTVNNAFEQDLPSLYVASGSNLFLNEDQIPAVDFYSNIVAQASAAGAAPNDVQITVEVREYGA